MPRPSFDTVDAYIAAAPAAVQPALQVVRATLRDAFVGAEETISYQIPTFRLHGTYALYFAGYAGHYAVYPVTAGILAAMGDELAPRMSGKATIRFGLDEPVPVDLLRRIAACRVRELEAKPKAAPRKKRAPPPAPAAE